MDNTSQLQHSLYEAMKMFADNSVQNSDATITIECKILEVVDDVTGEYIVDYRSNPISAHSGGDTSYAVGDVVYVLVPDGDFEKEKLILGTAEVGVLGNLDSSDSTNYVDVSENLIDKDPGIIEMSSYDTTSETIDPIIDQTSTIFAELMKGYINEYNTFFFGFSAKTSLVSEQRYRGNYGATLNLPVTYTQAGEIIEDYLNFTLDVGNMLGSPYDFEDWAPQGIYFTIDSRYTYDETRYPTIDYFCYDFTQDASQVNIKDVFLKDLTFKAVNAISMDSTGYSLNLVPTQGPYFSTFYQTTKTLTPVLKVNGKTTSIKNAEIYWFRESAEIKNTSEYYSTYGGFGWKCLNERTNVEVDEKGITTFSYITNATTLDVKQTEVKASARYKCVIILNKKAISATIKLRTLNASQGLILEATNGNTKYVKDTGYVNLSAIVYYDEITKDENSRDLIKLFWMRYDKNGNYIKDSDDFPTVVTLNELREVDGKSCYVTNIKFPVYVVDNLNTIYCSAKYVRVEKPDGQTAVLMEDLIGTEEITITTEEFSSYTLTIDNDDVIYKYDADGDSPMGSAYDGPSTSKITSIKSLNFTLRKANGMELTEDEYLFTKFIWTIGKNGMVTPTNDLLRSTAFSEDDNNYYFTGYGHGFELPYSIASRYNASKAARTFVSLEVVFDGSTIHRNASINFLKEGMNGSNGTNFVAQVVCGGSSASDSYAYGTLNELGIAKKLKFVYNSNAKALYYYDYDSNSIKHWGSNIKRIYTRVWEDSEELFPSTDFTVEYTLFNQNVDDETESCFRIASTQASDCSVVLGLNTTAITEDKVKSWVNILQAEITVKKQGSSNGKKIYAYYPLELDLVVASALVGSYVPSLDGGFSEVLYNSDGTNPSYDETSEFKIQNPFDGDLINIASQFYDISWDWMKSNLTTKRRNADTTGTSLILKPVQQFENGLTQNYVSAKISKKPTVLINDVDTDTNKVLRELINTTVEDVSNFENEITKQEDNKIMISNLAENLYKPEEWKTRLFAINDLFIADTKYAYYLNNMLETSLPRFISYLTTLTEDNELINITYFPLLLDKLKALQILAEQAVVQIKIMNGEDGKNYTDLISLVGSIKEISDYISERAASLNGNESKLTTVFALLEDLVSDGRYVETTRLNVVNLCSSNNYLSEYNRVYKEIATMCAALNSDNERFLNLKELCETYLSNFNEVVALNDILSILDSMYDHALKGILTYNANDGTYSISDSYQTEIKNKVKEMNEEIVEIKNSQEIYSYFLNTTSVVMIRPIVFYYNRHEMENVNAWDGNKLKIDDNGTYVIAPQMVAGDKDDYNRFSGVVAGLRSVNNDNGLREQERGLFGYYSGVQTFEINSNGNIWVKGEIEATAGRLGAWNLEEVIIDPETNKITGGGFLYSDDKSIYLIPNNSMTPSTTIGNGKDKTDWRIMVKPSSGNNGFGVDGDGKLYASGANIKGDLYAGDGINYKAYVTSSQTYLYWKSSSDSRIVRYIDLSGSQGNYWFFSRDKTSSSAYTQTWIDKQGRLNTDGRIGLHALYGGESSSEVYLTKIGIHNIQNYRNDTTGCTTWYNIQAAVNFLRSYSDRTLKKEIESVSLQESQKIINSFEPKKFKFNNIISGIGDDKKIHYGTIAQDLIKNLDRNGVYDNESYLVFKSKDLGYYQVHYQEFIPHLINVVKDQQKQIDLLKKEIQGWKN